MRSYVPSFFILALVLVSSIAFIAVLFFVYTDDAPATVASRTDDAALAAQASRVSEKLFEADTDNDGLADWEESLWNTDPRTPDTDGDGTPDGVEVAEGRDPLKNSEHDTISFETNSADRASASTTPFQNLTVTEKMGRELFGSYMSHKQHGTFGAQTQDQVVQSVIARAQARIVPTQYGMSDIAVFFDATEESYRAYDVALADAFSVVTPTEHELILVAKIVDGVDPSATDTLAKKLRDYETLRDGLLAIRVPAPAAAAHVALINAISAHLFNLEALQNPRHDPLRTATAAASYQNVEQSLIGAMDTLRAIIVSALA